MHAGRALVQAEYLRLSGRVSWANAHIDIARSMFSQAITTADQQGSGLFGLRAALDWVELEVKVVSTQNLPGEPLMHLQRYLSTHVDGSCFPDLLKARRFLAHAEINL